MRLHEQRLIREECLDSGLTQATANQVVKFVIATPTVVNVKRWWGHARLPSELHHAGYHLHYEDPNFKGVNLSWEFLISPLCEMIKAGVPLEHAQLLRWLSLTSEQILDAVDRGFTSAAEYAAYEYSDLNAEDIHRLRTKFKLADDFNDAGVLEALNQGVALDFALASKVHGLDTVEDLVDWYEAKIRPELVPHWKREGFSPEEAGDWAAHGVVAPATAQLWRRCNFTATEASDWIATGHNDARMAFHWRRLVSHPKTALKWRHAGFESPDDAEPWLDAGVAPEAAGLRHAAGLRPSPS